ncbi:hypothetical protein J7L01_04230 [bacterium]|nr:hypothetical protein [bacterium]
MIISAAIGSESDSLPESKAKTNVASAFSFPRESGHPSLMSRERFGQRRSIAFGYASGGENAVSIVSYTHSIDYILGPTFRAQAEIEVARSSSNGISRTSIAPAIRLDWQPRDDMRFRLNLRLSPQDLTGEGLALDPWHRPIDN